MDDGPSFSIESNEKQASCVARVIVDPDSVLMLKTHREPAGFVQFRIFHGADFDGLDIDRLMQRPRKGALQCHPRMAE